MSVNPEDWDVDFAFPNFNLQSQTKLVEKVVQLNSTPL